MTKPGTYQPKNGSFPEYLKVLLWGAGYPFGLLGLFFLAVALYTNLK